MFDRIAGVYDRMNSVMTAGMHHRWRAAGRRPGGAVGPATSALDVATGTGDLAIELRARVGPGGQGGGAGLLREHARAGSGEGAGDRLRGRQRAGAALRRRRVRRRDGGIRRAQLLRPAARAWRRWRASCAPAGGSWCWRSPRRSARRCPGSSASGSTGRSRRSAGSRATPTPTTTCRAPCAAFPVRASWAQELHRAGLVDVRWVLTAGGIIAIHAGSVPRGDVSASPQLASVLEAGGPELADRLRETEARLAEVAAGTRRRRSRATRRARWPPGASGCARCWSSSAAARAAACWPRPPRSSCCTWPRSCTTTCSTRRRCGAAEPTVFAAAGRGAATATGDLLFSRAFAELASTGSAAGVRALSRRLLGPGARRADAARRRVVGRGHARALHRTLRAQDGEPVRGRLQPRRAAGRSARGSGRRRWPRSGAAWAWRSRSSTTCSTCRGRASAPASTGGPTCWTAP